MRDVQNQLVLVALQRSGKPMTALDLLPVIEGLAKSNDWTDRNIQDLTLKSVARRLMNLADQKVIKRASVGGFDTRASRGTPKYEMDVYDPHAEIPPPPRIANLMKAEADDTSPYDDMDRREVLALLEAQDILIESMARFFTDLAAAREKAKRRLLAVGL